MVSKIILTSTTFIAFTFSVGALELVGHEKNLPRDMSFCIADVKYQNAVPGRDAVLKIVEFGEGGRSKFKGHDVLFGQGTIWSFFWNHVAQYQVPVWLIGMPDDQDLAKEMNLDLFTKIGGKTAPTLTNMKEQVLANIKQQYGQITDELCRQYSGIVLIKKGRPVLTVKAMKEIFPNLVFIGEVSNKYVNNKYRTSLLFMSEELKKYRPLCKSCSVEYDPALAQQLIEEFGCDIFVVKPINSSRGRGILMVAKEDLDTAFKILLQDKQALAQSDLVEEYTYWATYQSPNFLVEQYEPSKPIMIDNQPYDATMRLVFTIDCCDNNLFIKVFDGYWKLPAFPLTADCSLTDKHKSHVIPGLLSSAKIDQEDMDAAKVMLEDVLRKIYWQMLASRLMILEDNFN